MEMGLVAWWDAQFFQRILHGLLAKKLSNWYIPESFKWLGGCRDRKTGTRCYRGIGFRQHHLLRLAAQPRANPVRNGGRQQQQPRKGGQQGRPEQPPWKARPDQRRAWLQSRDSAAEAGGYMVLPCSGQEQGAGMAQSHQESTRGRNKNHAPGSDTVGTPAECHRSIPGAAEAVWRTAVCAARRRSRDAGVCQVKERAGGRKSPPTGLDHRLAGLEQGPAVRDERVGNPGANTPGGDRTCYQVALEDEPKRQFPGIPECGTGPDEEAVHYHPRGRGEDGGAV
jgi:hypothetical protein